MLVALVIVNTLALVAVARLGGNWLWMAPVILAIAFALAVVALLPQRRAKPAEPKLHDEARTIVLTPAKPAPRFDALPVGALAREPAPAPREEPPAVTTHVVYQTPRARVVEERVQRPDRVDVAYRVEEDDRTLTTAEIESRVDDLRVAVARVPTERELAISIARWGTFVERS